MAIILAIDLIIRAQSLTAFFADEGVLPIHILKQYNWNPYYFSFHALNGSSWWQVVLFSINAACIIPLLIGYRTRVFTFICWALLVSLQNRNPLILQGGDELLKLLLFWGIFLPWGERYSVQKKSAYRTHYVSLATLGYVVLVCSVYFFSALLKTSPEWRTEGSAIYYVLSLDQVRLPLGTVLYQFPLLMKYLTHYVFYTEIIAPIIIIFPFINYKLKFVALLSLVALHVGIGLTVYVGLFYLIAIISLIGLLPTFVIDWIDKKINIQHRYAKLKAVVNSTAYDVWLTLKNTFIICVITYCLLLNLSNLNKFPYALTEQVKVFGSVLRLEQYWGMFAPYVLKDDGYYVYHGLTETHKRIDVKHNIDTVIYIKPINVLAEYESDRWRKFAENYTFNTNNYMRPFYCNYLLKKWNTNHPGKKITELTVFFMKEVSLPNYKTKPIERLAVCSCQN